MKITGGNIFETMRMILPEHREMMERSKREGQRVKRPILEEDQLAEMSATLSEAIQNNDRIVITIYEKYGFQEMMIVPQRIEMITRRIIGIDPINELTAFVAIEDILNVRMV